MSGVREYRFFLEHQGKNKLKKIIYQIKSPFVDKNGNEIYEGDLLGMIYSNGKYHANALVKFQNGTFIISTSYNNYTDSSALGWNTHLEIIGNITRKNSNEFVYS